MKFFLIILIFISNNLFAKCIEIQKNPNNDIFLNLSILSMQGNFEEFEEKLPYLPQNYYRDYYIGYSYLMGKNTLVNLDLAEKYLLESSKYCFSPAFYSLGYLYEKMNLIEKSEIMYNEAVKLGDSLAAHRLGIFYKENKNVEKMIQNLTLAAHQGFSASLTELGNIYYDGFLVRKDLKKSFNYYLKSALKNDSLAQNNLGWMYENGEGVLKDVKSAIYWYEISKKNGFSLAEKNLKRLKINYEKKPSFL